MPVHDWKRVPAGIFHHFHHDWISELARALNAGLLPDEYYAMAEQQAAGFGPDVLTLQGKRVGGGSGGNGIPLLLTRPKTRFTAESDEEFYRRKKSSIVVRHVSGDRMVAMVEVVSPGNKAGRKAFQAFVEKAAELLKRKIHLLLLDLIPPTRRDPNGIHAAIWDEVRDEPFTLPPDKPLTLVAYECDLTVRAHIEPVAVGDPLPDMPLFLEPGAHVRVPLERTYEAAFAAMPRRWRDVLAAPD